MKNILSRLLIINTTLFLAACNTNTKNTNSSSDLDASKSKTEKKEEIKKQSPNKQASGSSSAKSSIAVDSKIKMSHSKWLSDKFLKNELKTFSQYNNLYKKWIKSSDGKDALQKAYELSDDGKDEFNTKFNDWKKQHGQERDVAEFKTEMSQKDSEAYQIYKEWAKSLDGQEKIQTTFNNDQDVFDDKFEKFQKASNWKTSEQYINSGDSLNIYENWRLSDEGKEALRQPYKNAGMAQDSFYEQKFNNWKGNTKKTKVDYENHIDFTNDAAEWARGKRKADVLEFLKHLISPPQKNSRNQAIPFNWIIHTNTYPFGNQKWPVSPLDWRTKTISDKNIYLNWLEKNKNLVYREYEKIGSPNILTSNDIHKIFSYVVLNDGTPRTNILIGNNYFISIRRYTKFYLQLIGGGLYFKNGELKFVLNSDVRTEFKKALDGNVNYKNSGGGHQVAKEAFDIWRKPNKDSYKNNPKYIDDITWYIDNKNNEDAIQNALEDIINLPTTNNDPKKGNDILKDKFILWKPLSKGNFLKTKNNKDALLKWKSKTTNTHASIREVISNVLNDKQLANKATGNSEFIDNLKKISQRSYEEYLSKN